MMSFILNQPSSRPAFSNEKLMMQVMQIPQILNNTKKEMDEAKELAKNPDLLLTKKDRARNRRMSVTWPTSVAVKNEEVVADN
jgi:hypothetical protein